MADGFVLTPELTALVQQVCKQYMSSFQARPKRLRRPRRSDGETVSSGGSETIQIARVLVKISKATSNLVADWGAGAVQYVDSTTGELVADSYVTVSNRWPIEYAVDSMVKIGETAGDVEGMCGPAPADFWQET